MRSPATGAASTPGAGSWTSASTSLRWCAASGRPSAHGSLMTVRTPDSSYEVRLQVPGVHNVRNALGRLRGGPRPAHCPAGGGARAGRVRGCEGPAAAQALPRRRRAHRRHLQREPGLDASCDRGARSGARHAHPRARRHGRAGRGGPQPARGGRDRRRRRRASTRCSRSASCPRRQPLRSVPARVTSRTSRRWARRWKACSART